jgi:hypothetical protein
MKRMLLVIPLLILPLFSACGGVAGEVSPSVGTAVAETQTAIVWTPTFIPTLDPEEPRILELLNVGLLGDGLDSTLDARYTVVNTAFTFIPNTSSMYFQLDVLCECAKNQQCCIPERIFVLTLWAMKTRGDKIIEQVPVNVSRLDVVCHNRFGRIGAYSAGWSDVLDYLHGSINGHMLGWRVTSNP